MKKSLFILATAAIALASCNNDVKVAENTTINDGNEITFRPLTANVMRANAAGVKSAWEEGDILYVNAMRNSTLFFQDQYVKDASGFNSSNKHYWPADLSTYPITFTAFWGVPYKTISSYSANDENQLNAPYTVGAVGAQKDILYAQTAAINAKPASGGVALNFRHMLSQIVVKVANSETHLDIDVTGVMIGNVCQTGTFQYSGSATTGDGNIAKASWTSPTSSTSYSQTTSTSPAITQLSLASSQNGTEITGYTPLILMPQQLTAATAYNAAEANPASPAAISSATSPAVNGSYIALQMTVKDAATDVIIVANQWCVWPIATEWLPGYKYTYTVNAGSGGYYPIDRNGDTDLDPVLSNSVIWFLPTCTIDAWDEAAAVSVSEPAFVSTIAAGGTKTINISNSVSGHFSITVNGIADADLPANPIAVTAAGNVTGTPTAVRVGTTAYITGVISAGSGTSTFTLTDGAGTPVVTTINIVQP